MSTIHYNDQLRADQMGIWLAGPTLHKIGGRRYNEWDTEATQEKELVTCKICLKQLAKS